MAQSDEIFFGVILAVAPEQLVVHLQILHASAQLAPPPVPTQH